MKYMFPDYNNGLINVIASIERYFGIKNNHVGIKEIEEKLKMESIKTLFYFYLMVLDITY